MMLRLKRNSTNKIFLKKTLTQRGFCDIISMLQNSYRGIAQLVEQRSPKPRAVSSSLTTPAKQKDTLAVSFLFWQKIKDLNSRGGFCVKQKMPVACFVAKTRVRRVPNAEHWVDGHSWLRSNQRVLLPLPKNPYTFCVRIFTYYLFTLPYYL